MYALNFKAGVVRVAAIMYSHGNGGSPLMEYLKVSVWLAGLFHDLGKGTNGFQHKISKAVSNPLDYSGSQDPIRHEFISALIIDVENPEDFMEKLSEFRGNKEAFLVRKASLENAENRDSIKEMLEKTLALSCVSKNDVSDIDIDYFYNQLSLNQELKWSNNPLWMSIVWLVFTHHKLPSGEWLRRKELFASVPSRHVGLRYGQSEISNISKLEDFLTLKSKDQPWDHNEWVRSVNRATKRVYELRDLYPGYEAKMFSGFGSQTPWMASLARVGRPCLVMADYEASCDAVKEVSKLNPVGKVFANTKYDEKGICCFADPLHVHLKKVGDLAPQIVQRLFINKDADFIFPSRIEPFDIPRQLQVPAVVERGRFEWQGHVQREMLQYRKDDRGFFCIVAAGTGRGKTRACAAIMTNSRDTPRFTVGLSMRSLTFQTAKSYIGGMVGFRHDQVAMLVGDNVLKRRFKEEKDKTRKRLLQSVGTENVLLDESEEQFSVLSGAPERAVMSLKSLKEDNFLMRLLSSPVSVMTIDHIVRLVDLAKSKDTVQFLHLMATDLVLDEVDDYKGDDLIVIGRLIEMVGQFGRRVVIASATLPKTVVEGFRSSYLQGYSVYQEAYGAENAETMVITHLEPYFNKLNNQNFGAFYSRVMGKFAEEEEILAKEENRRVVRTIKSENGFYSIGHNRHPRQNAAAAEHEYFGLCTTGVIGLHKSNALTDPDTGVRYSVGFTRFNSVVNAQKFVKWHQSVYRTTPLGRIMEAQGFSLKIMCYHAQTIGAVRVVQEQFLEKYLNRTCMNDGLPDPFLGSSDVQEVLGHALRNGVKDVVFMVVTSSIMDTGRDYDFDWALLEPCSTTSLIQAGGRVRRHRTSALEKGWNISIMPMSLNATIQGKLAWRDLRDSKLALSPNPSDKIKSMLSGVGIKCISPVTKNPDVVTGALSASLISGVLHAGHALVEPKEFSDAPLTSMERVAQLAILSEDHAFDGERHMTLGYATTHCDTLLSSRFSEETKFRGGNCSTTVELDRASGLWISEGQGEEVKDVSYLIYEKYEPDDSIFFLSQLNFLSRDHLFAFTKSLGLSLGYHRLDSELADSSLLGFSKDIDFDKRLVFESQIGFYEEKTESRFI